MPDDHIATPHLGQHGAGQFAGVGTLFLVGTILRADGDGATGQVVRDFGEVDRGRADRHVHAPDVAQAALQGGQERAVRVPRTVHLPVSGDQRRAHADLPPAIGRTPQIHGVRS